MSSIQMPQIQIPHRCRRSRSRADRQTTRRDRPRRWSRIWPEHRRARRIPPAPRSSPAARPRTPGAGRSRRQTGRPRASSRCPRKWCPVGSRSTRTMDSCACRHPNPEWEAQCTHRGRWLAQPSCTLSSRCSRRMRSSRRRCSSTCCRRGAGRTASTRAARKRRWIHDARRGNSCRPSSQGRYHKRLRCVLGGRVRPAVGITDGAVTRMRPDVVEPWRGRARRGRRGQRW